MSLASKIQAFAARTGNEFKAVRAELAAGLAGKAAVSHIHSYASLTGFPTPYGFELIRSSSAGFVAAGQYKKSTITDTVSRNDNCTVHDASLGMVVIPASGWWTFHWIAASVTNADDKAAIWAATSATATPTMLFEGTRDPSSAQKVSLSCVVYVAAGTYVMPGLRTGSLALTQGRFAGALVMQTA